MHPNPLQTQQQQPQGILKVPQSSRPSSQLSQFGSSGYGSTRSHFDKDTASTSTNKSPTNSSSDSNPTIEEEEEDLKSKPGVTWGNLPEEGKKGPVSMDDPGLDLIEAEVDSGDEENNNLKVPYDPSMPVPAPRQPQAGRPPSYTNMPYPLRETQSVEAMQVSPDRSNHTSLPSS